MRNIHNIQYTIYRQAKFIVGKSYNFFKKRGGRGVDCKNKIKSLMRKVAHGSAFLFVKFIRRLGF